MQPPVKIVTRNMERQQGWFVGQLAGLWRLRYFAVVRRCVERRRVLNCKRHWPT